MSRVFINKSKGKSYIDWQTKLNDLPSKVQHIYYCHLSQYLSGIIGLGVVLGLFLRLIFK